MKKKLSLLILMAVMCLTVLVGCGSDKNNNDNNNNNTTSQGMQEPSTNNNATDSTTDDANVTGNDGSNNNASGADQNNTNGTGNEGSVTGTNGSSEGVIDEIATDIGNGLENLGSDMTGADNSNVNDVTSGRQ